MKTPARPATMARTLELLRRLHLAHERSCRILKEGDRLIELSAALLRQSGRVQPHPRGDGHSCPHCGGRLP